MTKPYDTQTQVVGTAGALVAATATQIANQNAGRRAIQISNTGAVPIMLHINGAVSATVGLLLPNSQRPIEYLRSDYGELVTTEWWAFAVGGAGQVQVYEIIDKP